MFHLNATPKKDSIPSPYRLWYNDWVENNAKGNVLDVGKSRFWDYGFKTIDINQKLNPTIVGDICNSILLDNSHDTILCNGMYECVINPLKMMNEVYRILKAGGTAIFGFVGKDYPRYKRNWQYYDKKIDFGNFKVIKEKDFNNEYHFIICKK